MPQIVVKTGLLELVDKERFQFGDANPNDVIRFEFEYKGSESSIEYIETTCSCIKAWYEDRKIVGTLGIAKIQKGPYAKGQTSVGKTVNVLLNDGVSRYIGNSKKQRESHPSKRWFQLSVVGLVVVN